MPEQTVTIRPCHTVEEFDEMVELEFRVWEFGERDVVPSQMYVVAAKIGGQIFAVYIVDARSVVPCCPSFATWVLGVC